jgi:anti-anti-sigma regulatory factor
MLAAEIQSVRVLWVGLQGTLDASSWDLLHGCAKEVAQGHGLVIDLRAVDRIDDAGLQAVERLGGHLEAAGRTLLVVGPDADRSGTGAGGR